MAFKNPPEVNGVMELTKEEKDSIKIALIAIQEGFEPSDDVPVLSVHGLVSIYNDSNELKINGDTAQSILGGV